MNFKGVLLILAAGFALVFFSCTKINESSEVGIGLIPEVDNINTFDTTIEVDARYLPFDDSTKHTISSAYNDLVALGETIDPVFGNTKGDIYFDLRPSAYNTALYTKTTGVDAIDSVVLSLGYRGGYGDTSLASQITVNVAEIAQNAGFRADSTYRYDHPGFVTTGTSLGSKTFTVKSLADSVRVGNRPRDTSTLTNVLQIRLNNQLGVRLSQFDTSANQPYFNDSLFRAAFRGLAITTQSSTGIGSLAYFNLLDVNTKLVVYYRVTRSPGVIDTSSVTYTHGLRTHANSIKRSPAGPYQAGLRNPAAPVFHVQSASSGSYVSISIPGLSTLGNRIIHRAELIAYRVPSLSDNFFTPPSRLILDHKGPLNVKDSAYTFDNDMQLGADGSLNLAAFGGALAADDSYKFNITRYVQNLVTNRGRNDTMRLYAPFRSTLYSATLRSLITIANLPAIAAGRVTIAGTTPGDPKRLRLRIVYSKL